MDFIKNHKRLVIAVTVILLTLALLLYISLSHNQKEKKLLRLRDVINCLAQHEIILIKDSSLNQAEYSILQQNPKTFRFYDDEWGKVLIYRFDSIYDRVQATEWWEEKRYHEQNESELYPRVINGAKNILIVYLLDLDSNWDNYFQWLNSGSNPMSKLSQAVYELNDCTEIVFYGKSAHWQYTTTQTYYRYWYETPAGAIKEESRENFTGDLQYLGKNKSGVNTINYIVATSPESGQASGTTPPNRNGVYDINVGSGSHSGMKIDKINITVEWNGKSESFSAWPLPDTK